MTLDTAVINGYTTGEYLWSEADNAVLAILPSDSDPNQWIPGTDETQTGGIICFTANQASGAVLDWDVNELVSGHEDDGTPVYRDIGFLPGLTHTMYSHFRNMITEKWGVVVTTGQGVDYVRWAGLLPPELVMGQGVGGGGLDWFNDGYSVLYRAHLSLESQDQDRPFQVIGPVSNVLAVLNESGDGAFSAVYAGLPRSEPHLFSTSEFLVYLNVYRSVQVLVETSQEISYDFKLVQKIEITEAAFIATSGIVPFEDRTNDIARAQGISLYTNAEQEGEQASYYCPPTSRDVAVFRDTTFYANRASLPALVLTVPGAMTADVNIGLFSEQDRTFGIGVRKIETASVTNGSPVITVSDPAYLVGVVPGQAIYVTYSPDTVVGYVVSVGASTITMDRPWTGATTTFVLVATHDTFTMHVFYADGTDAVYTGVISSNQLEPAVGFNVICPGLRVFGPSALYPLPSFGATVTWIHTYPAIKRVLGFDLAVTNGQNYYPAYTGDYVTFTNPLKSLNDTRPNRLFFSKHGQPEEVPLTNYIDIGAGTILKTAPTQSALLVLCTDGLWRVTGDNPTWQVYQVDPTITLLHPSCLTTLNNQIYGWVEDGLALIGEDGAQTISTDAVGPDIRQWATAIKGWGAPYFWGPSMAGDRFWNEAWLNIYRSFSDDNDAQHVTTLVYNTDTKNFTHLQDPLFANVIYSPDANRMISSVFVPGFDGGPADLAITVQSDFYDPVGDGWQPATIWFNALQTDDKGKLKQWMDVNYFVADVIPFGTVGDNDFPSAMHGLFSALNDSEDTYADNFSVNTQMMLALRRDVHFWIPRREALSDQIQLGVQFNLIDVVDGEVVLVDGGFNFQLQGFTVRYRVASDTLKR